MSNPKEGKDMKKDVIFVPAFGTGRDGDQIFSNQLLLDRAVALAQHNYWPIFTDHHVNIRGIFGGVNIYQPRKERRHESTRYAVQAMRDELKRQGVDVGNVKVHLVAAPNWHGRRAAWELKDAGFAVEVDHFLDWRESEFYCSDSVHWQTWFKWGNWLYERGIMWNLLTWFPKLYRRLTK